MRVLPLAILLVPLGLTGCTQGDPGVDDFDQSCPAWTTRMDSYKSSHFFFFNGTTFIGPHAEDGYPPADANPEAPPENFALGSSFFEFGDKPLDRLSLKFEPRTYKSGAIVQNGHLEGFVTDTDEVGVFVSDQRKGALDRQESIVLEHGTAGNFTYDAILAEPGQEPNPRGLRIDWYFTPAQDATEDDPSFAAIEFTVGYWYRICG